MCYNRSSMKCEICHKFDAKKAIRLQIGGKERELYVCNDCADRHAERLPRRNFNHRPFGDVFDEGEDGRDVGGEGFDDTDMPFQADEGTRDASRRHETLAEDIPPCPECGTTIEDLVHTRLLGCPHCYTAFRESLLREYGLHGSFGGKQPKRGVNGKGGDAR